MDDFAQLGAGGGGIAAGEIRIAGQRLHRGPGELIEVEIARGQIDGERLR